jgi:hypothetical protein
VDFGRLPPPQRNYVRLLFTDLAVRDALRILASWTAAGNVTSLA